MLVNIHHDSPAEHRRLLVAGVAFLTVIALLIGLSIAVYQKTFERVAMITIEADRAGLQLAKFGDVRVNGALVGQVRSIRQDGKKAVIRVGLKPAAAREIPENVSVEILPTTLFGQKFVSFVLPAEPAAGSLRDGDVISADRVETNVELQEILADLFPLLRAVRPADLNATLSALARALDGRGEQLGSTLDELGEYLGAIEGSLPTLREDLAALADVAGTYEDAAPDLLALLRQVTVTSRTVLDQREQLDTFFGEVTGVSTTSTRLLRENEQGIIRVGELSEPVLKLLAVYSPEFPCLLKGTARYAPQLAKAFEGNQIKQYIEFGANQYQVYDEDDLPEFGEVGHGPWCLGLPDPPFPIPPQPLDDGTDQDNNPPNSPLPSDFHSEPGFRSQSSGYAGTPGDQAVVNALLAGRSGRPADSYGSLGSLMYGPVVRESGGAA